MSKIVIANNCVPFIYGGAEFLADSLSDKLMEYGHKTEIIKIPFSWNPVEKIEESIMTAKLLRVIENVDQIIALKFPAYHIEHDNKVLWLLHQFRQAYDLRNTEYDFLSGDPIGERIRKSIIEADNFSLPKAKRICTNSKIVSDRLMKHNGLPSEILYPPLMDVHLFTCAEYGNYIFYPSRLSHYKRQHLIVKAMKYTKSNVKLVIAGKGDTVQDEEYLLDIIEDNSLSDKVTLLNRFISQEEKAELFSKCLGCTYVPYDEDSYGYVTLESYHSRKPVITCTDSGGTDLVVLDGVTGYMVEPDSHEIAEAMDKLYYDKKKAKEMGVSGFENLNKIGITWDNVIERLVL